MKKNYKLSELFHKCAYEVPYIQIGHDVTYAFVEEGDTLYIYFQGSNQVTDWIRNFLFKKRPYKDMKIPYRVHRGFLAAWKEVEDIVINRITEREYIEVANLDYNPEANFSEHSAPIVRYKWKRIFVVGYSHGAALAALCHECVWFYRKDLREDGLKGYGFEAPRMFGAYKVPRVLRERWESFTVIRTNNDIVTHCPPKLFRYTHVGKILKVHGDISLVKSKWIPCCVKAHYPQIVYDALTKEENTNAK